MLTRGELPWLAYMFQCYYFQAWDDVFGDDEDAPLATFIAREKPELLVALKNDIDGLLARDLSDAEIDAWVDGFYVGPLPPIRGFLEDRRHQLAAALAATTRSPS